MTEKQANTNGPQVANTNSPCAVALHDRAVALHDRAVALRDNDRAVARVVYREAEAEAEAYLEAEAVYLGLCVEGRVVVPLGRALQVVLQVWLPLLSGLATFPYWPRS